MSVINVPALQDLLHVYHSNSGKFQIFLFEGTMPQPSEIKACLDYDDDLAEVFNLAPTIDAIENLGPKLLYYMNTPFTSNGAEGTAKVEKLHNKLKFSMGEASTDQAFAVVDGTATFAVMAWTSSDALPLKTTSYGMLVGSFGLEGSGCDFEGSSDVIIGSATIIFSDLELRLREGSDPLAFVDFTGLGQETRQWIGMTQHGSDVFACDKSFVYKQTGGTGDFVVTAFAEMDWTDLTSLNGQLYGCVGGAGGSGAIYKMNTITNAIVVQGGPIDAQWVCLTSDGTDVYAAAFQGLVYKQTGGTGDFTSINTEIQDWGGLAIHEGSLYGATLASIMVYNEDSVNFEAMTGFPELAYYDDLESTPSGLYVACKQSTYAGIWRLQLDSDTSGLAIHRPYTSACRSLSLTEYGLYIGTDNDIHVSIGEPI